MTCTCAWTQAVPYVSTHVCLSGCGMCDPLCVLGCRCGPECVCSSAYVWAMWTDRRPKRKGISLPSISFFNGNWGQSWYLTGGRVSARHAVSVILLLLLLLTTIIINLPGVVWRFHETLWGPGSKKKVSPVILRHIERIWEWVWYLSLRTPPSSTGIILSFLLFLSSLCP